MGFPGGSDSKESACNAGDSSSTPGWGRSPGGGHGNPPWYSCLENPYGQNSLVGYRLLFMGFLRQEYWTGLPSPSSGGLPHKGWNWCLLDCWWILYHCATSSQLWTSTRAQKCQLESTIQKLVVQLMYFHFFLITTWKPKVNQEVTEAVLINSTVFYYINRCKYTGSFETKDVNQILPLNNLYVCILSLQYFTAIALPINNTEEC